jgi:hypothetical protein
MNSATRLAMLALVGLLALACDDSSKSGNDGVDGDSGATGGAGGGTGGMDAGMGGGDGGSGGTPPGDDCLSDDTCEDGQYCDQPSADEVGVCRSGCRTTPDTCGDDRVCDPDSRECVDGPCSDDSDCSDSQYCDTATGECTDGCRTDPDNCPATEDARPQSCNGDTRACEPLFACCGNDNVCQVVPMDACDGDVLADAPAQCTTLDQETGEEVPLIRCDARCAMDADCDDTDYCNEDGICQRGCRLDDPGACEAPEVCDSKDRVCVIRTCEGNDECEDTQFCELAEGEDQGACQVGCRQDPDNCPEGQRCGPNNICGEFCEGDEDCGENQFCDPDTLACVDRCDPDTHEPCADDEFCNDEGRCVAGCRPDPFEPNSREMPSELVVAAPGQEMVSASICPSDSDWYAVAVPAGARMRVTLTFDAAFGNLEMALYDPAAELIEQQIGPEDRKQITYPMNLGDMTPAGVYLIEVRPSEDDITLAYDLTVQLADPNAPCFVDAQDEEAPGDDDFESATVIPVPPGQEQFDAPLGGSICLPGDRDWFRVGVSVNTGLELDLERIAGNGPIVGELFRVEQGAINLNNPIIRSEPNMAGNRATFDIPAGSAGLFDGTAYLLVRGGGVDGDEVYGDYLGTLTIISDPEACAADPAEGDEGNDDINTAYPLGDIPADEDFAVEVDGADQFQICPADNDVFELTAEAGDELIATIDVAGATGELIVEFLDQNGGVTGMTGRTDDGAASATIVGANPVTYYVRVRGAGNDVQGPYALTVRRNPPMGGMCAEDPAEVGDGRMRNDTPQTATDLAAAGAMDRYEFETGRLCDPAGNFGDQDWYKFRVREDNSTICVMSNFLHSNGNVDLAIFEYGDGEACGNFGNEAQCATHEQCAWENNSCVLRSPLRAGRPGNLDRELIQVRTFDQFTSGDYWLRVDGGMPENSYGITITVTPDLDSCDEDDWQEIANGGQNNSRETAVDLGAGTARLCDAWLCRQGLGGDQRDWYQITVPAGESRTIYAFYDEEQGDMELSAEIGEDVFGFSPEALPFQRCINVQGDDMLDTPVLIEARAGATRQGPEINYRLEVVPADLDADPNGLCDVLSGNLDGDGQRVNVDWPTIQMAP